MQRGVWEGLRYMHITTLVTLSFRLVPMLLKPRLRLVTILELRSMLEAI